METYLEKLNRPPKIGITMGDAGGIGAEVILKVVADKEILSFCSPVIIGDAEFLLSQATKFGLPKNFLIIKKGEKLPEKSSSAIIYDLQNLPSRVFSGTDSAIAGKASAEYIEHAVEFCLNGQLDALSTAPISKKSLNLGGYNFQGHTEFLAKLTKTEEFAMSFFASKLRVVLLSTHVSLLEAIKLVTTENLIKLIKFTDKTLSELLGRPVKLAVAGLNPHASEGGMFGNEEQTEILPAIKECREKYGINVFGAFSPDTIFLRAFKGEFDAVIAGYHDQATIAVKCLSFGASVNVTLGLPIIRTSVDHGTAFDIAGKNIAESESMKTAIKLAAELFLGKINNNLAEI